MRAIKWLITTFCILLIMPAIGQVSDTLRYKSILFEIGGGVTASKINADTDNEISTTDANYGVGYFFDLSIHRHLSKLMGITTGIGFVQNSFSYRNSSIGYSDNNILREATVDEQINSVNIPLLLTYEIHRKKIIPYMNVGIDYSYLLSSNATANKSYKQNNDNSHLDITFEETLNLDEQRNKHNLYARVGLGIKLKWDNDLIKLGISYNYGLTSLTKVVDNTLPDDALPLENGYDFHLNYFSISVGYVPNIYKK